MKMEFPIIEKVFSVICCVLQECEKLKTKITEQDHEIDRLKQKKTTVSGLPRGWYINCHTQQGICRSKRECRAGVPHTPDSPEFPMIQKNQK